MKNNTSNPTTIFIYFCTATNRLAMHRQYFFKSQILIMIFMLLAAFAQSQNRTPQFTENERNWSEYDLTGWRFGINIGMYFANNYSAQYYSGERFNENNIEYVLNNKYWYEEIVQELNSNRIYNNFDWLPPPDYTPNFNQWLAEYDVQQGEKAWWIYYPVEMKYDAAISPGFYVKYNFNNTTGVFAQTNYVELKTSGAFQMTIDTVTYTSEPGFRTGFIRGKERRSTIDIGISKFYRTGTFTSIFIETGLHMNSTKVLESRIQIGRREYNLVNNYSSGGYVPNSNGTTYEIYQGGIGFGIFLNGGLKFILNEQVSIDPGFSVYYKNLKLEGYSDFKPDIYAYVRLIFDLF
ncbi:MAG: hypothetical protein K9H16_05810 [Bacteroidales bacterium]|nr:hypothetical protein [Bacteroidales bacterium]